MQFKYDVCLVALSIIIILSSPEYALAVEGFSVSTHWSTLNENFYGGYGQIWRHDIIQSQVVKHTLLFAGPARLPALNPAGTQVAFLNKDGKVCVMSIEGGPVTELAQAHGEAHLDWPQDDWIFFTLGGFHQPTTSRILHAVNVQTGIEREMVTFKRGIWHFGIAADLTHSTFRPDDVPVEPWMRIVAYNMDQDNGILRLDRSSIRPSCGAGMDPAGVYFMKSWPGAHEGVDIMRWDDLSQVKGISHKAAELWGGTESGTGDNRGSWSVNSQKWVTSSIGWGFRGNKGANQVLYNWIDEERIVVTENKQDKLQFDDSGDFWVKGEAISLGEPRIHFQPQNAKAPEGQSVTFSVIASGDTPLKYQWQKNGMDIIDANEAVFIMDRVTRADDGSKIACHISNPKGSTASSSATLNVLAVGAANQPPLVEVGPDQIARVNAPLPLIAHITDDGLPNGKITVKWTQVSGPDTLKIEDPFSERTQVILGESTDYVLRLIASDGELSGQDEVTITGVPKPVIKLLSPSGGEVWEVGTVQTIRWETEGVDDVSLAYSTDDGTSWTSIAPSIDRQRPSWGAFEWTVPSTPSTHCRVAVAAYIDGNGSVQSAKAFEIRDAEKSGCSLPARRRSGNENWFIILLIWGLLYLRWHRKK